MEEREFIIIIKGKWNIQVFTPDWIVSTLFKAGSDEEVEFSFDSGNLKVLYRYQNIVFIPSDNQVEIKIDKGTDTILTKDINKALESAIRLVELLPHTPGLAVGLNYRIPVVGHSDVVITNEYLKDNFLFSQLVLHKKEPGLTLHYVVTTKHRLVNYQYDSIESFKSANFEELAVKEEELWKKLH